MNKEANMERLEVFDFIIEREGNIQIRDRDRLCMRGNGFEKSGADYHYYTVEIYAKSIALALLHLPSARNNAAW